MEEFVNILKREALVFSSDNSEAKKMEAIAVETDNALGYKPLLRQYGHNVLVSALVKLNIQPFTNDSVERYKAAMLEKLRAQSKFFARHNDFALWVACSLMLGIGAVFIGGFSLLVYVQSGLQAIGCLFGTALFIAALCKLTVEVHDKSLEAWQWRCAWLHDYHAPLPVSVLETTLRIRKELPSAKFSVDYLTTANAEKAADPFLLVECGGAEFYIAVWDEPNFEGAPIA